MLTKKGDKPIGKCKKCESNIFSRNKKYVCAKCGDIHFYETNLFIYPMTRFFNDNEVIASEVKTGE